MYQPQIKILATYMRGGTSKGVFIKLSDLPSQAQQAGSARDALLLRIIGSPDPYGKHIDGMGGGSSSTSKIVLLSQSTQPGHDVDYLFGQVAIDKAHIDWSGNCGNLTAAVGSFAIQNGLISPERIPDNQGPCTVRIWQANIGKTIIAHVPTAHGQVVENGDFELDGVTFASAEIPIEFINPADNDSEGGALFPTGNLVDTLHVDGIGNIKATLINSGIPTVFINAKDLQLTGTELQDDVNNNPQLLAVFESIRAAGAVAMGLIGHVDEAMVRQHTPKVAFVAPANSYIASSGKAIDAAHINLVVRALSMGKLHHAMMGTAAVAIGTAAAIEGTLVNQAAGGGNAESVCFGHPSGTLRVGASASLVDGCWQVNKAVMSRSARTLMTGFVHIPDKG